ncbi:MAG TPA: YceH family protein [Solirubrobacteraceae bacterium]|nr:YceH family protein [Solirubrobacteraceae bacterium]
MHIDTLTAPEQRVLGCLIEKRFTTPDQYPLTLNALRMACNQSTNREPIVAYDEDTVREAAQRLARYGLARLASGHSSRATKYRHLAEETLGLSREPLAVLSVLLLRGAQTPGELKARTERMVAWPTLGAVEQVLATLIERGYARRLDRRPGQKEERYAHLLGEAPETPAPPPTPEPTAARTSGAAGADRTGTAGDPLIARLTALEARVEQLARLVGELTGESL